MYDFLASKEYIEVIEHECVMNVILQGQRDLVRLVLKCDLLHIAIAWHSYIDLIYISLSIIKSMHSYEYD